MSDMNIDIRDNRTRIEIMNSFNSFEQLNQLITDLDELTLHQYVELSHKIPYDSELMNSQSCLHCHWIFSCIKQMIDIIDIHPRAFKIPLTDLEYIGIDIYEFNSKIPKWAQPLLRSIDDDIKRQKRFLRRNNLVENIDYIQYIEDINGEFITTGFKITRFAFGSLILKIYGCCFMTQLTMRVTQILVHYERYIKEFRLNRIETLQRTIIGLSEDINELIQKKPRDSYNEQRYSMSSKLSSSVIMDNADYSDELTHIHSIIESSINRMDGRISDIHIKLADITNKIDDLASSIVINIDESRNSEYTSLSECQPRARAESNPILNHVNTIFNQFRQLNDSRETRDSYNGSLNRQFRYTCIGNEGHL